MSTSRTPQLLSRHTNGTTSRQSASDAAKAPKTKPLQQGEKVVIRRLPPGMTEEEFLTILGDDWKLGNGKVDWFSYRQGKVSKHASKPSTPSRAYLHVVQRDLLTALVQVLQSAKWEDAKETYNDPVLVSPPTVEFALFKKIPSDKKRVDGRQGTIDQDPEFMAFLEALANPDAHKEAPEADQPAQDGNKTDKTTTTPLVAYIKEKKAAKAKETAAGKNVKHARQESQATKGKATPAPPEEPKKKSRDGKNEKEKGPEKAPDKAAEKPRESVKVLTKKAAAAAEAAADAAKAVAAQMQPNTQSAAHEPLPKSRKAGIAAAAKILQRDLGLSPGNAHRKARQDAAKAEAEAKATAAKENKQQATPPQADVAPARSPAEASQPSAPAKSQPPAPSKSRNRKRGEDSGKAKADAKGEAKGEKALEPSTTAPAKAPIAMLKKKDGQQGPASQSQPAPSPAPAGPSSTAPSPAPPSGPKATSQKQGGSSKKANPNATPSPGATRAFIKHANHSQGVTETLLKESLQAFGTVTSVEIDRKKGFAYVDFADHNGLAKAMAASPVTVAQATVQILERKEMGKKSANSGAGAGQAKNAAASAATAPDQAPATATTPAPTQKPAPTKHNAAPPPAPAAAPSGQAEKTASEQQSKRGGRRRGGRGRGDKENKESKEPPAKDGGASKPDGGGTSAPAAHSG